MSRRAKRQQLTDEQALSWARPYFKAASGEEWGNPPLWSQLVKAVDQMVDELKSVQAAMRQPMAPGAFEVIESATQRGLLGDMGWEDDFGKPMSDSCLLYYAEALDWASRGAPAVELREIDEARRAHEAKMAAIVQRRSGDVDGEHAEGAAVPR